MLGKTIDLFHFTSQLYLPLILREGLTKGDAPLDKTRGINAVNLTAIPERTAQKGWTRGREDKTRYRLTVRLTSDDPNLVRWRDFPRRFQVNYDFFKVLTGDTDPYKWFIYTQIIPPTAFIGVFDFVLDRFLSTDESAQIAKQKGEAGKLPGFVEVVPLENARR